MPKDVTDLEVSVAKKIGKQASRTLDGVGMSAGRQADKTLNGRGLGKPAPKAPFNGRRVPLRPVSPSGKVQSTMYGAGSAVGKMGRSPKRRNKGPF